MRGASTIIGVVAGVASALAGFVQGRWIVMAATLAFAFWSVRFEITTRAHNDAHRQYEQMLSGVWSGLVTPEEYARFRDGYRRGLG